VREVWSLESDVTEYANSLYDELEKLIDASYNGDRSFDNSIRCIEADCNSSAFHQKQKSTQSKMTECL